MSATATDNLWNTSPWRAWTGITILGVLLLVGNLVQVAVQEAPTFRDSWLYLGAAPVLWWLGLPVARWATWRFHFEEMEWWRLLLAHAALSFTGAFVVHLLLSLGLLVANELPLLFLPFVMRDTWSWQSVFWPLLGYLSLAVPFYAADFYRNWQLKQEEAAELQVANAQLETRVVRANLDALKMQLQPHFLFNTLNSITALIRKNRSDEAEEIVAGLGELLRHALEHKEEAKVPLEGEMRFLRRYFEIERIRFQDRLQVEIDIDPQCENALVPALVLQPLVENAMKHGFSRDPRARLLKISARRLDNELLLTVYNDGPLLGRLAARPSASYGIGTQNTRMRLQMMYGEAAALTLRDEGNSGVVAQVILPFQLPT